MYVTSIVFVYNSELLAKDPAFSIDVLDCKLSSILGSSPNKDTPVDKLFQQQLNYLLKDIAAFKELCKKKASILSIKNSFKATRLTYKKAAVLIEYFYPYERRLINGPDIKRSEDDNPDNILSLLELTPASVLAFERLHSCLKTCKVKHSATEIICLAA